MLIQPSKDIVTLALQEPEIPGRTEPQLPSGEWGINLAAAIGNFPDKGLRIQILPWTLQGLGDNCVLLWDGINEVDQQEIEDATQIGERMTLWVGKNFLQTGSHTLTYRVHRFNQAPETFAPSVRLYVKLELPGGQDIDPELGSHSNLYMAFDPPEVVTEWVDEDMADTGIKLLIQAKPDSGTTLPYPNMAVGDVITASWGGVLVKSDPVTAAQISDPVNNPLFVQIKKEHIIAAGDTDDDGLAVTFMITDLVKNISEDWCHETRIKVGINTSWLDAPILEEAQGNQLDLDILGDEQMTLMVWAASSAFKVNDVIIMHIRGTTLEGMAIDVKARETLVNHPSVVKVKLPNSAARALAKTQVVFSYELERNGVIVNRSKGRFINIIGEARRLAAPIADDALQGAIDPDLQWTYIRIPYDTRIVEGTGIEPHWNGTRPDGSTYFPDLDWEFPSEPEANDPKGFPILVNGKHLKALEGGTLELSYDLVVEENNTAVRYPSLRAALLQVGEPKFELVAPIVLGELNGALEPADLPSGRGQLTAPRPTAVPTVKDDEVTYTWIGEETGKTENMVKLTTLSANRDVHFPLDEPFVAAHMERNRGKKVTASYRIKRVSGKTSYSNPLEFVIGQAQVQLPVATFKEARGDQLNPDDVSPNGATVVIPATALLKTNDHVIVSFVGITTTNYPYTVQAADEDRELSKITVPHAVILSNDGLPVSISYVVQRSAGGRDGPSDPTVYDVRTVIGPNNLKVMGARSNRSTYRSFRGTRILSAFDATTEQPLQAQWKYPNDSQWTTAATWSDSAPHLPLQVRAGTDQITLNPANIIGNGINSIASGESAFVAHRDAGDLVGWGNAPAGGTIPSSIITLDDIVEVSGTTSAYAARRVNGTVVVWGNPNYGGTMGGLDPMNFVQVVGNSVAFAGIKNAGHVVAWGVAAEGGTVPAPINTLTDIVKIVAGWSAFAALRATGQVVAWGRTGSGVPVPAAITQLTDIKALLGNTHAFAALRANRTLVAWGSELFGGVLPAAIANLTDVVELSRASDHAFTAIRATGQVVAWGDARYGGTLDSTIAGLTDIVEVSSTRLAFAARRANGHVVAWGWAAEGATVPADIAILDDIVQVCGSSLAFAALRKDGTVVAWGNAAAGGDTSAVVRQLTNVQALYENASGFTALTSDGRVVTWGQPAGGGDSSAVQHRLVGQVSYQANAVSRGLALKASSFTTTDEAAE